MPAPMVVFCSPCRRLFRLTALSQLTKAVATNCQWSPSERCFLSISNYSAFITQLSAFSWAVFVIGFLERKTNTISSTNNVCVNHLWILLIGFVKFMTCAGKAPWYRTKRENIRNVKNNHSWEKLCFMVFCSVCPGCNHEIIMIFLCDISSWEKHKLNSYVYVINFKIYKDAVSTSEVFSRRMRFWRWSWNVST